MPKVRPLAATAPRPGSSSVPCRLSQRLEEVAPQGRRSLVRGDDGRCRGVVAVAGAAAAAKATAIGFKLGAERAADVVVPRPCNRCHAPLAE